MSELPTLTIETKMLGRRKPQVESWSVTLPQADGTSGDGAWRGSLRALLTLIVTDEVDTFQRRQEERRLARVMTREQIEQGAAAGKVDMGGREPQAVHVEDAVASALQAFEDRLYLVLLDGAPVETLDSEVALRRESHLTFVRLVALVGG